MDDKNSSLIKEQIIKKVRSFFYKRDFHEVIVPILNEALPLEPNLHPFSTVWKTQTVTKTMYLPMSPERGLKQMLALGIGNCFAISKSFRNLERTGSLHMSEFLMLEWYREKATYKDIMTDVEDLFFKLCPKKKRSNNKFPVYSLKKLFKKYINIDLGKAINDEKLLFSLAHKMGYQTEKSTWSELYDQLFVNEIESKLPKEPLFLVDFPARISPLCKPKKNDPIFAERFEFYLDGIEIGNGNTENTDVRSLQIHFENQHRLTGLPIDESFLNSLKIMNDDTYAGVGIGIERLAMVLSNK